MLLKVDEIADGLHPSEAAVVLATKDGLEVVYVDRAVIEGGHLRIGYPVGHRNGHVLVELPRETTTGAWRVWVNEDRLSDGAGR